MQQSPKLIIIAGPNGSGKTTITHQILQHEWKEGCVYINPDEIAQQKYGDWNDKSNVLKAAKFATAQRKSLIKKKESLIFETVFSSQEKIEFLLEAKAAGYFIRLFFIGTDHPSINAARITKRVLEGGHDVPIPKIIDRYAKSISNCCVVAPIIDRLYVYDNSVDYIDARLLFRASAGRIIKLYGDVNPWATCICQTLK
jgi:predicted ABC-type ATPase